ncbi:MAG: bifunctional demethylmenaquinone methyltransferase/2-methoxy-6-polyprenyl-1,4-benzoquinol methylase UbiE [Calditrichales bacterium]|nr:MAG: bifunctional demethylmenaquinone methyltransferase/2-methoxy-6-polyprenyl-1,4-benzoquinol methylase UbiE [Calditrichales bacterium]
MSKASTASKAETPPRTEVWRMFDRIAGRYDLLNHLLSLGQDIRWRKKVSEFLPERKDLYLLDLATGTGDQLLYLMKNDDRIKKALGLDLAREMLKVGRKKMARLHMENRITLEEGDAERIGQSDNQFDVVTISFGIRNVTDVKKSLNEMNRVLKPGGRVLILEFSLPGNKLLRNLYLYYFRHILPAVGSIISGDGYAYRYLNRTVETFPYGDEFCALLRECKFEAVSMRPLTFGIATVYYGDKNRPVNNNN